MGDEINKQALEFCQKWGHTDPASVGLVATAIRIERERCIAIINLARMGEIDGDLRCIRSRIHGGDTTEQIAAEKVAG